MSRYASGTHARNGCFAVLISSLLAFFGIVGIAVAVSRLGFSPSEWLAQYRQELPILVCAVLDLLAGIALGFERRRWAIVLLVLAVACRLLWMVLSSRGWLDTGGGGLEVLGLLVALWHERKAPPDSPSASTPLRGEG